jgi:hypothetical protein
MKLTLMLEDGDTKHSASVEIERFDLAQVGTRYVDPLLRSLEQAVKEAKRLAHKFAAVE